MFQPQIIRDRDNREREKDGAKEIPLEFSPERDIIAHRKKTGEKASLANKETFGLRLNNLNLKPKEVSAAGAKNAPTFGKKLPTEVSETKLPDFIADHQKTYIS